MAEGDEKGMLSTEVGKLQERHGGACEWQWVVGEGIGRVAVVKVKILGQ